MVRACAFGEYLASGTRDACSPCEEGTFNLAPSATECSPCPDAASCGALAPAVAAFIAAASTRPPLVTAAAAGGVSAIEGALASGLLPATEGFLLPGDGAWHSSCFSDRVRDATYAADDDHVLR